MPERPLPVPDGHGIYGFPDDLLASLDEWQEHLRSRRSHDAQGVLELVAPFSNSSYVIADRTPRGRPVLALEPHHDDLILSAGGYFLSQPRPLTVVTVFTQTNSVHPEVGARYTAIDEISALRAEESRQALLPLHATHHLLGLKDADPPYAAYDPVSVGLLADMLRPYLDEQPDAELIAPASVTRDRPVDEPQRLMHHVRARSAPGPRHTATACACRRHRSGSALRQRAAPWRPGRSRDGSMPAGAANERAVVARTPDLATVLRRAGIR